MRWTSCVVASLSFVGAVGAQQNGRPQSAAPSSAVPAEASQYDFLIGQWELVVRPKVSGIAARIHGAPRLLGTWKAWKVLDGRAIEDELRIVDGSGNPSALTLNLRLWSPAEGRWLQNGVDGYRARVSSSTATRVANGMEATGKGADPGGAPVLTRSRFTAITPTSFRFAQDRSNDEGRTWEQDVLVIDAKRVAAVAPR